jgi:hypothetical protein
MGGSMRSTRARSGFAGDARIPLELQMRFYSQPMKHKSSSVPSRRSVEAQKNESGFTTKRE